MSLVFSGLALHQALLGFPVLSKGGQISEQCDVFQWNSNPLKTRPGLCPHYNPPHGSGTTR